MGVHWKISLLEEVSQKTNIGGGDCLKGGLRQFADLRGVGEEREGGVFEGGSWYPNAHYETWNITK